VYRSDRAIAFAVDATGISIGTHKYDESGRLTHEVARDYARFHRISRGRFGGEQLLVGCPQCDRRCRILHSLANRVGCRFCLGLLYASENMGARDRNWWQVMKIRRRVDTDASVDEFPARRPRMKRRIYRQLMERHNARLARLQ
jgi:hypothetical protein